MKIFKYPLYYFTQPELVRLPKGAQVINFGIQEENEPKTVFWALVDENETELEDRVFILAGTGHEIPGNVKSAYGTHQFPHGLVFTFLELEGIEGYDPKKDDRLFPQGTN